MVWRTNESLTRGNEIPKKSCRPLQGSGELQERGVPFSMGERGLGEEGGRKIRDRGEAVTGGVFDREC